MSESTDPVDVYQALQARRARLARELAEAGQYLAAVANGLTSSPPRLMISNKADFAMPLEISRGHGVPNVNWDQWPAATEIADKLTEYHVELPRKMQEAWARIPENVRKLIQGQQ